MHLLPLLSFLLLPLSFVVAKEDPHAELVKLAAANNGVIPVDERVYNLLTSPKRTWSSAVQFTALDPRRRCTPCK